LTVLFWGLEIFCGLEWRIFGGFSWFKWVSWFKGFLYYWGIRRIKDKWDFGVNADLGFDLAHILLNFLHENSLKNRKIFVQSSIKSI
jgi:hypothetical protein